MTEQGTYEDFLDLMDVATDHVHRARGYVTPDGRYARGSIVSIDRAIERLQQARAALELGFKKEGE